MKRALAGPALLGLIVLLAGAAVMAVLLVFKRAPAEATVERDEKPMHVAVQVVQPGTFPVEIQGFGQVAAKKIVTITPEAAGRVISIHPSLIPGGRIPEGALLFALDDAPYAARVADSKAQLQRQESALLRVQTEARHAAADLKDLRRNADLAEHSFARAKKLYDEGVGSQSAVDDAERSLISARNEVDQLSRSLDLYPIREKETQSDISSAKAQLDLAELALGHTRVHAPFSARVKIAELEENEVVAIGTDSIVLVDDSILEISVPLNGQDARKWLQFEGRPGEVAGSWFSTPTPATCKIRWTEEEKGRHWEGTLHRVETYDQDSRTLTMVVRVAGDQVFADDRFPLVEGMFCEVFIPGRAMEDVYRLEPHVVSFENTVYVADGDRLKTVPVEVVRIEEDFTYVAGGLSSGDQVITTRLVNPLDQSLLSIVDDEAESAS
jgi:membrane fusion protein, multidrug efflux system